MKKKLWLLGVLLFGSFVLNSLIASEEFEETTAYRVTRSDYFFSKEFNMDFEKTSFGKVVKSVFHIATHYDGYDRFGLYEGRGICRILFSSGLFYTWATEIDVYDANGADLGMIDGQWGTTEAAKFTIYDYTKENNQVAIAYLDRNSLGFNLIDPYNSNLVIARLTRNYILDTVDNWDVVVYYPEKISPLLVKIFAAFACDKQHKFKADK